MPAIIYADLECLLEKMHLCRNNPEKSYTDKKTKHTLSGYSLFTNCSFDAIKNKQRFKKEHAMEIINYEQKEMIPLTSEENKYYQMQKLCHIYKKRNSTDKNGEKTFKLYHKVRDHCHYTGEFRGPAHNICTLRYKTPKEIPIAFHNGSTYDNHSIVKQLAKEFEGQFECLGENTEEYITFSVPIKKELDNSKAITYQLKFIDSFRFMSNWLYVSQR